MPAHLLDGECVVVWTWIVHIQRVSTFSAPRNATTTNTHTSLVTDVCKWPTVQNQNFWSSIVFCDRTFLKIKLIWIKSGNTTQQEQAQWETIVILPAVLKIQLIFYSYFSHATNHWDRMHPGMGHVGVHTFLYSPSSTINPIRNDYRLWILRLFCLIVFECASRRAWCCMYYAMQELYINHWYHLVLPLRKYIELEFLTILISKFLVWCNLKD